MAEMIPYAQLLMRLTRVEVRINDIPIMLKETDGVTTSMRPIREFLIPGSNTAEFIVEPVDIPLSYRNDPPVIRPDAAVRMRIAVVEDGEFLDFNVGEELFDIAAKPSVEAVPPVRAAGTFEATTEHKWAWSTAPAIDPIKDRAAIEAFISKVSALWAARDTEGLLDLLELRFAEDAKAYPVIDATHRKIDFRNALAEDKPEDWKPVPVDFENAVCRSVANGKLVEVLDRDGLPLIRTEANDPRDPADTPGYFPLPMMLGFRNGAVSILL